MKTVADRLRELPEVMETSGTFSKATFEYGVEGMIDRKRSFYIHAFRDGTAVLRYGISAPAMRDTGGSIPVPYEATQSRDALIAWLLVMLRMI